MEEIVSCQACGLVQQMDPPPIGERAEELARGVHRTMNLKNELQVK